MSARRAGAALALIVAPPLAAATLVGAPDEGAPLGFAFREVAAEAGLGAVTTFGGRETNKYLLETTGTGAAWIDYDGDGWLDVFLVNGTTLEGFPKGKEPRSHLYRNRGDGTFEDRTPPAIREQTGWGQGACVGDYDSDGRDDLFVTYYGQNRLYRNLGEGRFEDYSTEISEGMVVLDAVHRIQAEQAPDLACRWNCKAGKCGSCSAEINGSPKLMCMTRLDQLPAGQAVTVEPMRAFPHVKDLVTDVSWNFEVKKLIKPFRPRPPDASDGTWRMDQRDVDRVMEFRKCIECFLCQDVCHVLRDHNKHEEFIGPRFFVYAANQEMNPIDAEDRVPDLKNRHGIGYCNITKCCTRVCPEHIHITDNAIIPLKERVVDRFYDPLTRLLRMFK